MKMVSVMSSIFISLIPMITFMNILRRSDHTKKSISIIIPCENQKVLFVNLPIPIMLSSKSIYPEA